MRKMKTLFQKVKKFNYERGQRGIAIYFAVAALSIVLAIAMAMCALVNNRLKMLNQAGDAVIAFSVAQTGIERALYDIDIISAGYSATVNLGNDSEYRLSAESCGTGELCIKSVGKYRDARRAIKIKM